MHARNVGELMLHSEDLNLLIKCNCIDSRDPDAFLVVKLVFEVLNVEVLQLTRHGLYLLEQLIVCFIHSDLLILNHVV